VQLPDFPWDSLHEAKTLASRHPEGLIDLSVGSPIDQTVESAVSALQLAGQAPGYPYTSGSNGLVEAIVAWWVSERRALGVGSGSVLPVIGSKEAVALLPTLMGLGPGDTVVHPVTSYPTYEVGALVCGATPVRADDPDEWPESTKLVWINSPSNPTGEVLDIDQLRHLVAQARARGVVLVSDECSGLLGSEAMPVVPSVLDRDVLGDNHEGVLALHSLSKQANMAGYRAAFLAGDHTIIDRVLQLRRHMGLIVPTPIQAAVQAALKDTESVHRQRERYQARRKVVRDAFESAGWRVDHSEAGLYLWLTRGEGADSSVQWLAARGLLVAPGYFYGPAGQNHVRVALTISDEEAAKVAGRLES
jgi:succinyldiaminopimelate transaminase